MLLLTHAEIGLDIAILKKVILFLLPLSLHMLIGGGMEYVDGFLVARYFEVDQFAIFRYGARELPFVSLIISAFAATMIPSAVENEKAALFQIKQQVRTLSYWMYPLTFVLMIVSPFLFPLIYNESFKHSALIFNIYLLIITSRILLPQVLLYSRQHTSILVYSAIIELAINLGLSLVFIKHYGLVGIAIATVIAYFCNKLILIGYVRQVLKISVGDYLDWKNYLLFNSLLIAVFWYTMSSISI
jgi:O-antigen/teichoic acid export membrane protein